MQLKGNQKELVSHCRDIVRFTKPLNEHTGEHKGRNRVETRVIRLYRDSNGFIQDSRWQTQLKAIYHVERTVQKFNTSTKRYNPSREGAFYVSNKELSAKEAFGPIKKHWRVENANRYVRDVSMLEDFFRIRVNPGNMARVRSFALNAMRKNGVTNIKGEMYENSLCFNRLYGYQHFV